MLNKEYLMIKKLLFCLGLCAFLGASEPIIVSAQEITKTIKEDILLVYAPLLYDVKVDEKKGQIHVILDSKESVGQREFEQMAREIKEKIAVLLQKDAVVRYNAAGKLLHEM